MGKEWLDVAFYGMQLLIYTVISPVVGLLTRCSFAFVSGYTAIVYVDVIE